jgi:hypothetical protein
MSLEVPRKNIPPPDSPQQSFLWRESQLSIASFYIYIYPEKLRASLYARRPQSVSHSVPELSVNQTSTGTFIGTFRARIPSSLIRKMDV